MALPIGCVFASVQLIFPNEVRGQVSAVMLFFLNLGGLSLGPLLPGLFNDYLFHSEKMIGMSVALTIGLASLFQLVSSGPLSGLIVEITSKYIQTFNRDINVWRKRNGVGSKDVS
jgi:hypothetical protein